MSFKMSAEIPAENADEGKKKQNHDGFPWRTIALKTFLEKNELAEGILERISGRIGTISAGISKRIYG